MLWDGQVWMICNSDFFFFSVVVRQSIPGWRLLTDSQICAFACVFTVVYYATHRELPRQVLTNGRSARRVLENFATGESPQETKRITETGHRTISVDRGVRAWDTKKKLTKRFNSGDKITSSVTDFLPSFHNRSSFLVPLVRNERRDLHRILSVKPRPDYRSATSPRRYKGQEQGNWSSGDQTFKTFEFFRVPEAE